LSRAEGKNTKEPCVVNVVYVLFHTSTENEDRF